MKVRKALDDFLRDPGLEKERIKPDVGLVLDRRVEETWD